MVEFYPNTRWFIKEIEELEKLLNYQLSFSEGVLHEICLRYERDIPRYNQPNLIKQAAHLTFWIKKLKPILIEGETSLHANGVLAFYCARAILEGKYNPRVELDQPLLNEIIYSFRYRFTSPQSLFIIFQTLYHRPASQ